MVFVHDGQPFAAIARELEAAGVVRSRWTLRLWARWSGGDRQVHSGDYRFDGPLTAVEVLDRFRVPGNGLHRVTIPEGSTLREVAELFAAAGFAAGDQFLCVAQDPGVLAALDLPASGAEGYLFPDTYSFAWSTSPADILLAMVQRFREQAAALEARRRTAALSEPDMVTLASIIEKETGVAHERSLVAAVFRNRLRVGMRLQADPTAIYGRAGRGAPSAADLDVDSPYNTYLHQGLPPGPICNPGDAALAAAIAPAAVDYLYFVARGDGTHAFARTLAEHNQNVGRLRHAR
jgi:UPF0755 protein